MSEDGHDYLDLAEPLTREMADLAKESERRPLLPAEERVLHEAIYDAAERVRLAKRKYRRGLRKKRQARYRVRRIEARRTAG